MRVRDKADIIVKSVEDLLQFFRDEVAAFCLGVLLCRTTNEELFDLLLQVIACIPLLLFFPGLEINCLLMFSLL